MFIHTRSSAPKMFANSNVLSQKCPERLLNSSQTDYGCVETGNTVMAFNSCSKHGNRPGILRWLSSGFLLHLYYNWLVTKK